jgi:protein-tyrosine phosphatase
MTTTTVTESAGSQKRGISSYSQLNEYIYIGGSLSGHDSLLNDLIGNGIRGIVSLEIIEQRIPAGIDYYFWLPWPSGTAPALELVDIGVRVIETLIQWDVKMYIQCGSGVSRAPLIAAAYYMHKSDIKAKEAIAKIKEKHPITELQPSQKQFLRAFETQRGWRQTFTL